MLNVEMEDQLSGVDEDMIGVGSKRPSDEVFVESGKRFRGRRHVDVRARELADMMEPCGLGGSTSSYESAMQEARVG